MRFGLPAALRIVCCLCLALLAGGVQAAEIRFGVTPQFERRQLFAIWKPILAELEKQTGQRVELVTAPDIPAFEKLYNAGAFDFAYVNPYLVIANPQGYLPLVRDEKPIRGILVVGRDSPLQSPGDLDGKEIAFPAPNAVGASLLVRAELSNLFHIQFTPVFVNSHTTTYLQVAQGLVPAGGGVQKTLEEQKEEVRALLRVIHRTGPVPSLPVVAHPRVAPALQAALVRTFLALGDSPEGKLLLKEVPMPTPVATSRQDYEVLREMGLERFFVPGQ